ncbi:DNA polymerase III subunit gamma and tau [Nesterenkonia suensis]
MSTALYRRYRPDTFADVIGQEHVTAPLVTALGKDSVSHAYLFSGPRGCGKTTSARILARCLNCAEGPTGEPCGHCESCRDLATGGSGSLDVIEIDAASHGGVDDARDLRERATFAPVRDRYKIFIIDEAHMVTAAGFNALLKIVEEPPEHIKFIFATTEPDKVIGTIRSRTHHYPFRLVPPEPLLQYLQKLCDQEQVPVAHGVLPLVIRAGGGSVRDTLSVLDQLIAGSTDSGLDYDRAVALLGFTHATLLDDVVDSVAALDGSTAFSVVDRVVQSGQDPRRFVEDLLERLRDLIIVKSVPDSPGSILRGVPADQIRRMQDQAAKVGSAELSRAADITAHALTDMVGATSPRLHLELLMARLLLPHADQGTSSLAARLERLERRVDFVAGAGTTPSAPDTSGAPAAPSPQATPAEPSPTETVPAGAASSDPTPGAPVAAETPQQTTGSGPAPSPEPSPAPRSSPAQDTASPADDGWATPGVPRPGAEPSPLEESPARTEAAHAAGTAGTVGTADAPTPSQAGRQEDDADAPTEAVPPTQAAAPGQESPSAQPAPSAQPDSTQPDSTPSEAPPPQSGGAADSTRVEMLRRAWPEIVQSLASQSRLLWMLVKDNATVAGFDGKTVTLAFTNDGARATFSNRRGDQALNAAIHQVLGMQVSFDLITGGAPPAAGQGPKGPSRPTPAPAADRPAQPPVQPPAEGPAEAPAETPLDSAPPHNGRSAHPPRPGTWSSYAPATPTDPAAPPASAASAPAPAQTAASSTPVSAPANSVGPEDDQSAPAWLAEEAPEPYDAEPESPQPPPSPHPAWNGDPSGDPAGSALSADSPSEADVPRDPAELTDPTFGPTTARTPSLEGPAPQDQAPPQVPAPRQDHQGGPAPGPDSYQLSTEKPPVPVFARPSARPTPSASQPQTRGEPTAASPPDVGGGSRTGASGRIAAIKQRISQRSSGAEPPGWNDAPPPPDPLDDQGPPPATPHQGPGDADDRTETSEVEDIPSDDDITVEESSVFGRKAIERILGGTLIEERRMGSGPQ